MQERATYPSFTLNEVLLSCLKVKQDNNKERLDYLIHFKSERDVALRMMVHEVLDGYIKHLDEYINLPAYDNDGQKAINMFEPALILYNADHNMYGDLLVEYWKVYTNKEIRHPKLLSAMMDFMHHKPIRKKQPAKHTPKSSDKDTDNTKGATSFA